MRLTVPPLEIGEDEGFSKDKDIFKRKGFGEQLSNLIENTDGELVIALDAPWGEGKSTFVKMWRGHLKQKDNGIHTIYFDAFESDHQSSPFLALASEIYNLLEKKTEKTRFEKKVGSALKTIGKVGLQAGVRILTGVTLNETTLDAGTQQDIAASVSNATDKYISDKLKLASKDKVIIKEFKEYLKDLPPKLSYNGKSIVFIIDELDRCKPPFALEIVEIVKHLFAVPNITFVLVMNRTQLEASVRNEYGTADASKYLQKFINLYLSLPKVQVSDERTTKVYLRHCVKQMEMEGQTPNQNEWIAMFEELVDHYNLSLREIERCLTNFSFIRSGIEGNFASFYNWIAVYVCIIKVKYLEEYNQLSSSKISYIDLFKRTDLTNLVDRNPQDSSAENHNLKWALRYCLMDESEHLSFIERGHPFGSLDTITSRNAIKTICQWLDSFRMN
ncbi:KAP family P-loop NTPase fold protein [Nitrosovibrio sp. Nv4]|uniref:KAP family P-loop NTPase fold protein n=1 Tax=Nitrosovibrio sp. Nv4 TaxID=1945880 RepID=UPI000BCC190E|nr:P-loop NTPase fold protein [Nitrosovibrio sp. Nv4]SOD39882.1 KAP family P-loop domain-containing protein [Nitrosovibrio sp. Nv4]